MVQYAALWLLVRVGGRLPLVVLDRAAIAGGGLAWLLSRRLRAVTRDHMRHVLGPAASGAEVDRAAREVLRTVARRYAEFAHLPRLTPARVRASIVQVDGMEALTRAAADDRGAIIVSAHLGSPELLSHAAPTFGLRFAAIEEPLRPQRVHDFVHAVRAVPGVAYFPATLAGLRSARAHLAAGGALGLLVDRDVLATGEPYAFFGERALMPTGAIELARRSGAPIFAAWCYRLGSGRYRLAVRPLPLPPAGGDRKADVASGMRVMLDALEDGIREAPGQWFPLAPVWRGLAGDHPDGLHEGQQIAPVQ